MNRNHYQLYLLVTVSLVVGGAIWFGRRPQVAPIERHLPLGNALLPLRSGDLTQIDSSHDNQLLRGRELSNKIPLPNQPTGTVLQSRQSVRPLMPIPSPPLSFRETPQSKKSSSFANAAPLENATPTTLIEYSHAESNEVVEGTSPSPPEMRDAAVPLAPAVSLAPSMSPVPTASQELSNVHVTAVPELNIPLRPERKHRIVEGDTLEGIAQHYYEDVAKASAIFAANRSVLQQPDILPLGVKLVLPGLPVASPSPVSYMESRSSFSGPSQRLPQTEMVPIQRPGTSGSGP